MCGYAVEFLRSCYSSKWKIHRDSDQLTAGRYYFSPLGTPHYPGLHNFGSRVWVSDERDPLPALGEWDGAQTWFNGIAPRPLPLPILVGNADCIEHGLPLPDPVLPSVPDNTCDQFPLACFGAAQAEVAAYDITCCATQLAFAEVVNAIYQDIAFAKATLQSFLGAGFTYSTTANGSTLPPGSVIAVGTEVFVFLGGTTNYFQLGLQLVYASLGPVDQGGFSTNPAWYLAALAIEARMTAAGAAAQTVFYFVGHSFGGALAQILGARMRMNRPTVLVNVVTFGSPCAGDSRLVDALEGARQRHYCNPGDPVPGMPPRTLTLFSFFPILTIPLQIQWATITPPHSRVLLSPTGQQTDSDDEFTEFDDFDFVVSFVVAGSPVPFFEEHAMAQYVTRLRLSCAPPGPPWVFENPIVVDWLNVQIKYLAITYSFSTVFNAFFSLIEYDGAALVPPVGINAISVIITPLQGLDSHGVPFGPIIGCSTLFSVNVAPTINFMVRFLMEPYAYWVQGKDLWFGPPEIFFGFPVDPENLWVPLFNAITFDSLNIEPP